ncbi:Ribosomal large subunit pseudouridine synthase A [Serinicoccus hydrothermalis]|uniref:RNA pseudouridylate synthase n=2 Tax=Serinicoccus hydrothermalis TaxID=1758689 RepID=A0A1B1NB00_9MICO|nr:Ribosomal large subunit pseudouridine synthase A [Serinicoccus hydrothermalis]
MPDEGTWRTVVAFLLERTGDEDGIARRLAVGEIRLADGTQVDRGTAYRPGGVVHLYRDLPDEVPVPVDIEILEHDESTGLLVVDKPPFLATMPRGAHVAETVVVRLRRELGLPEIVPVHRLDRLTSGVLLLTTRAQVRGAYQRMVEAGGLRKTYEALAPTSDRLDLPLTLSNRIVKERGTLQARVVDGEPNATTRVELLGRRGGRGHYRLTPLTGRTHQLRLHLATLGIPVDGDPLYPTVRAVDPGDFSTPLQLLAAQVSFVDPVSGRERSFSSRRALPVVGVGVGSA